MPKGEACAPEPGFIPAGPEGGFNALVWLAIMLGSLLFGSGTMRVSCGDTGTRNNAGQT